MLKADLMDPLRCPLALAGTGPLAVRILCISGETHPAGTAEGKVGGTRTDKLGSTG